MSDQPLILIERKSGWAEIVLNRPERRNSLIAPMANAITSALNELAEDNTVQTVILRGNEGYFCSGIDLKALQSDPPPAWAKTQGKDLREMHLAFYHFPKPVIGAFEAYGINAGAALALACDVLITGESAFMQIGEMQQGAPIPMNAAWLKIKTSELTAARLVFYADRIGGQQLLELGLATECVADSEVVNRCRALAERVAGFPAGASTKIKSSIVKQRGIEDPETFFPSGSGGSNPLMSAGQVKN